MNAAWVAYWATNATQAFKVMSSFVTVTLYIKVSTKIALLI